jgi:hypothetical protein
LAGQAFTHSPQPAHLSESTVTTNTLLHLPKNTVSLSRERFGQKNEASENTNARIFFSFFGHYEKFITLPPYTFLA